MGTDDRRMSANPLPARFWAIMALLLVLAATAWLRLQPLLLDVAAELANTAARNAVRTQLSSPELRSAIDLNIKIDRWIAEHPSEFAAKQDKLEHRIRDSFSYQAEDGGTQPYLGILDSYVWLRLARNLLTTGSPCDEIRDSQCRDNQVLAPVGNNASYAWSLHVHAIAGLHRLLSWLRPAQPLPLSAFLLQVVVGASATIPAFLAGRLLAGTLGGVAAALLLGANAAWLNRSLGGDTDVWNVALPMWSLWAILAASHGRSWHTRTGYAVLAATIVGLHAAIWRGWPLTFLVPAAALVALLVLEGCRLMARQGKRGDLATIIWLLAAYLSATALATALAGVGDSILGALHQAGNTIIAPFRHAPAITGDPAETAYWPNMFIWIEELQRSGHGATVDQTGAALLALALVGLAWCPFDRRLPAVGLATLALAAGVAGLVVFVPTLELTWLLVLAVAPVTIALFNRSLISSTGISIGRRAGSLLLTISLLAALYLGYKGDRFVMLVAPALSVAAAIAIARCHDAIADALRRIARAPSLVAASTGLIVAMALLALPLRHGYQTALHFLPKLNDGWAQIFHEARRAGPPETIVTTWWDYGTWAAFLSGRRVTADGTTLGRHVHHWVGRALAETDERRAIGLLRMLACGSDPSPTPGERTHGAYGRMVEAGLHPLVAYRIVDTIAGMNAGQARRHLIDIDVPPWLQDEVLRRSHCRPPPGLLVVNDELVRKLSWLQSGLWDHRIAYVGAMASVSEAELDLAAISGLTGFEPARIKDLHRAARALPVRQRWRLATFEPEFSSAQSYPCRPDGDDIECRLPNIQTAAVERNVAFRFPATAPGQGSFLFLDNAGRATARVRPALIAASNRQGLTVTPTARPHQAKAAVLIDLPRMRAIYGPPQLMASLYAQLMFLDGRHSRHFHKITERVSIVGERISLWRIVYPTD